MTWIGAAARAIDVGICDAGSGRRREVLDPSFDVTPGMSQFIIRRSSDLGTLAYPMGQNMDFPPAGSRGH